MSYAWSPKYVFHNSLIVNKKSFPNIWPVKNIFVSLLCKVSQYWVGYSKIL